MKDTHQPTANSSPSQTPYIRKLSFSERFYLVADALNPGFCNQMVLEGLGKLDLAKWRTAVERVAEANPGSRLVLKGSLASCHWFGNGPAPFVTEVDGGTWSGLQSQDIPYQQRRLDPFWGPTCEVVLIHGTPNRVVFRSFHGVMDGRGTSLWAEDIFRALRKEPVSYSHSSITDYELAKRFQREYRKPMTPTCLAPVSTIKGNEPGFLWYRKTLTGGHPGLVAKIAVLLEAEARKNSAGTIRFMIPVDMRPRMESIYSTGNLSNPLFIEISQQSTWQQVAEDIKKQHQECGECKMGRWEFLLQYVPLGLLRKGFQKVLSRQYKTGNYIISGILSNIGKVNLDVYAETDFRATTAFFIPPSVEGSPFFAALSGSSNAVEVTVSMPRILGNEGRIEEITEKIATGLMGWLE